MSKAPRVKPHKTTYPTREPGLDLLEPSDRSFQDNRTRLCATPDAMPSRFV